MRVEFVSIERNNDKKIFKWNKDLNNINIYIKQAVIRIKLKTMIQIPAKFDILSTLINLIKIIETLSLCGFRAESWQPFKIN